MKVDKKKVLMVLNQAPHYREPFLALLAQQCELTVVAGPCSELGLLAPEVRGAYEYRELESFRFLSLRFTAKLGHIFALKKWDVICCSFNLNCPQRLFYNLVYRWRCGRWLWWGHIIGLNTSSLVCRVKRYFLNRSDFILAHSKVVSQAVRKDFDQKNVISFNNTECMQAELRALARSGSTSSIKLLFVGRPQERKRLDRLVDLLKRNQSVDVRIVGPGMPAYIATLCPEYETLARLSVFEAALGEALEQHVEWSDCIVNPGHLGLLVVLAGRFCRGIVVDTQAQHAPEVIVAQESEQVFINWDHVELVDRCLSQLMHNPQQLDEMAWRLHELVKREYTIENMLAIHARVFGLGK